MKLTFSFRIDGNDKTIYPALLSMSKTSKDLYNQALFEVKTRYYATGEMISYPDLDKIMKTKTNLEGDINYRLLPARVAQQTLMLVEQNIKSFFKAKADYKEHPEKYLACPQFPNFLNKDGHFVLVFTNQQAKITDSGDMKLTRDVAISIPEEEFSKYKQYFIKKEGKKIVPKFNQVRIVPKFNGEFFNIEIIYDKDELKKDLDIKRVASLDIGVNNLITLVDTAMDEEDRRPLIINGKPIKSVNQFYNKKRAEIQSSLNELRLALTPLKEGLRSEIGIHIKAESEYTDDLRLIASSLATCSLPPSKALGHLTDWRNEKINDYMHKASRFVINHCLDNNIGHIVIGKNDGWKQEINIGKRNNQNFVFIPFNRLIDQIQYKAKLVGILVTTTEEGYTSKCSALDLEKIGKHEDHAYAGKRVERGLFRTSFGFKINADVNGALNILRKVIGDTFLKPFVQKAEGCELAKQSQLVEKVARLIPGRGYLCYPFKVCF